MGNQKNCYELEESKILREKHNMKYSGIESAPGTSDNQIVLLPVPSGHIYLDMSELENAFGDDGEDGFEGPLAGLTSGLDSPEPSFLNNRDRSKSPSLRRKGRGKMAVRNVLPNSDAASPNATERRLISAYTASLRPGRSPRGTTLLFGL